MPKNNRVSSKIYGIPYSETPFIRTTRNSNKDYEGIRCPICFEHPHNAVLLICSSYDKGCRPFICNTRCQFNCLGQYRVATSVVKGGLRCPLCRGHVSEERAVEGGACEFMDRKPRSCERCEFVGARKDLETHWWVHHSAHELDRLLEVGYADPIQEVHPGLSMYDTSAYDTSDEEELDIVRDDIVSDATPTENRDEVPVPCAMSAEVVATRPPL